MATSYTASRKTTSNLEHSKLEDISSNMTLQKPLHVAIVHSYFPPLNAYGGIVRYIVALSKGYQKLGHRVTVITRDDHNPRVEVWQGITVHYVASKKNWFSGIRLYRLLFDDLAGSATFASTIRSVHQSDPLDLVEFSNYGSEGFFHSLRKVVPHVTRVVTMGWQSQQINQEVGASKISLRDRWANWKEHTAIRNSDLTLTPTQFHADIVSEYLALNRKPIAVPLGADLDIQPAHATPPSDNESVINFLFVGKCDPRKGFEILIRSFCDAYEKLGGGIKLTVVGQDSNLGPNSTSYKDYALSQVSSNIRENIDFLGWVKDEDIANLYLNCDIFIAPSRYESFGLIYLEAMQCRKPVIGCKVGGVMEVVSDLENGLLINPDNSDDLTSAMVKLSQSKELRLKLGDYGYICWSRQFTEEKMCERTLEVYQNLLSIDCIAIKT